MSGNMNQLMGQMPQMPQGMPQGFPQGFPRPNGMAARWENRPLAAQHTVQPFTGLGIMDRIAQQSPQQLGQPGLLQETDQSNVDMGAY